MSHPLFGPEIRLMLQEGDAAEMKTFCETLHPATIAESLADEFQPEDIWRVLQASSIRDQAAIFEYFPIEEQVKLAEGTGRPHMARLIETMSHDDRVHLLKRLQPRVAEGLLRLVDEADRRDIATLVNYQADTVGSLMTTDYAWIPAGLRAHEALERLRQQAPNSETIYYIYVLDEATRRLLGVVSLRQLVLANKGATVRDLMEQDIQTLRASDKRELAATELRRYDFLAMPVVDDERRLVGIVTHDDVMDVVVEEATEDAHMMGAVGPMAENYLEANFVTVWRKRAFWLAFLFVAQMLTFNALTHFEGAMKSVFVLMFFVPLITSTGGNSGSQAATLITRAMALGQVGPGHLLHILRHELVMGLALGLTLALIGYGRAWLTPTALLTNENGSQTSLSGLTKVIALSVGAICLWGTLVGALLPLSFRRLGIDPGVASGPFVATFVDVTGIVIYFSIAKLILM